MLSDKQLELIEMIVKGEHDIRACCKLLGVPTSNYYYWQNNNKAFQDAYSEAIELKVERSKLNVRKNVDVYINRLDKLSADGNNEVARINAIAKLLTLAELDPQYKQEVTIKNDDSENKNYLLSLLEQEKEEE